jgi:hypothetical protein
MHTLAHTYTHTHLVGDEVGEGDALSSAEGHGAIVGDVHAVKGQQHILSL